MMLRDLIDQNILDENKKFFVIFKENQHEDIINTSEPITYEDLFNIVGLYLLYKNVEYIYRKNTNIVEIRIKG